MAGYKKKAMGIFFWYANICRYFFLFFSFFFFSADIQEFLGGMADLPYLLLFFYVFIIILVYYLFIYILFYFIYLFFL